LGAATRQEKEDLTITNAAFHSIGEHLGGVCLWQPGQQYCSEQPGLRWRKERSA